MIITHLTYNIPKNIIHSTYQQSDVIYSHETENQEYLNLPSSPPARDTISKLCLLRNIFILQF